VQQRMLARWGSSAAVGSSSRIPNESSSVYSNCRVVKHHSCHLPACHNRLC
jgi:hypothetical protein